MFYPHPVPYQWHELYRRFLTCKLDLPDAALSGRREWSCGVGDHALGGVVKLLWRVSNSRIFIIPAGAGYGIVC